MNIIEIINKKSLGKILTKEELSWAFNSYLKKDSPDYKKANEYFQKALKLKLTSDERKKISLNSSDCYQKIGTNFLDKRMYKEAVDNFLKALDLKKDNK